jgi:hypothetical protein
MQPSRGVLVTGYRSPLPGWVLGCADYALDAMVIRSIRKGPCHI